MTTPDNEPHGDRTVPVRNQGYIKTGDYVRSKNHPKSRPRLVTAVFWEPRGDSITLEGHNPFLDPVPSNRFVVVPTEEM